MRSVQIGSWWGPRCEGCGRLSPLSLTEDNPAPHHISLLLEYLSHIKKERKPGEIMTKAKGCRFLSLYVYVPICHTDNMSLIKIHFYLHNIQNILKIQFPTSLYTHTLHFWVMAREWLSHLPSGQWGYLSWWWRWSPGLIWKTGRYKWDLLFYIPAETKKKQRPGEVNVSHGNHVWSANRLKATSF